MTNEVPDQLSEGYLLPAEMSKSVRRAIAMLDYIAQERPGKQIFTCASDTLLGNEVHVHTPFKLGARSHPR